MPAPDGAPRLLILGGTGEARVLAAALAGSGIDIVTSLAGRTRNAPPPPGRLRVGGFGGAAGLADYLVAEHIDLVVDATHPFAAEISDNAAAACATTETARLVLARPAWTRAPGDIWIEADNVAEAAALLPRHGRRAFLSTGRRGLEAFAALDGMWFLVRLVDPPATPLPLPDCHVVAARGPFAVADEGRLLDEHRIDVLVCKASGGDATAAKLAAARERGLPVIMIRRPPAPSGRVVPCVDLALAAIRAMLDGPAAGTETRAP